MKIKKEFVDLIYNGEKKYGLEIVVVKQDFIK